MCFYVAVRNGFVGCNIITRGIGLFQLFWAQMALALLVPFQGTKSLDFQGPPLQMPQVMMLHPSKPLSTSGIKTTGTLVVLCTRVLLCSVVVCCCVLLCVRGVVMSPCCVRRYSGGGVCLAGLPLPLPL